MHDQRVSPLAAIARLHDELTVADILEQKTVGPGFSPIWVDDPVVSIHEENACLVLVFLPDIVVTEQLACELSAGCEGEGSIPSSQQWFSARDDSLAP